MAKEIGFKKSGAEVGRVGLLKTVPDLCELDQNHPYVVYWNC